MNVVFKTFAFQNGSKSYNKGTRATSSRIQRNKEIIWKISVTANTWGTGQIRLKRNQRKINPFDKQNLE